MRPIEMLFNLVDKFAPMDEGERTMLRRDASDDYELIKSRLFSPVTKKRALVDPEKPELGLIKPTNIKERLVLISERWEVRLLFAFIFIWVVPKVQEYMHPSDDPSDFDEFDDDFEDDDDFDDDED